MREYELTYLISDNVPESELNKVTGKVGGYIDSLGGKILKEEIWGRRKLAYPIKKQEFATYITVNFDLPAEKAHEFERNIELTSKIIRHLMIVKDFGGEALTLTAEDIAETKEIKEVIGSEKSFEAIEGETEESKDLMAVREKTESEEKEESPSAKATDDKETIEKSEKAEEEKKEDASEEKVKEEKPKAKKAPKKKEDEADRLSKLDKELDEILGEDL
jgi:small subunit ribosomal protein S6